MSLTFLHRQTLFGALQARTAELVETGWLSPVPPRELQAIRGRLVAELGKLSHRGLSAPPVGIGDAWWWRTVAGLVPWMGSRERRALTVAIGSAIRAAVSPDVVPATEALAYARRFTPASRWNPSFAVLLVRPMPAASSEEWREVVGMLVRGEAPWGDLVRMRHLWASYRSYVDSRVTLTLPWTGRSRSSSRGAPTQTQLQAAA